MTCLTSLRTMLAEEQISDPVVTVSMNDLMGATLVVQKSCNGMINLTDTMKQELIEGIKTLKSAVANAAFHFYETHEFEPRPEVIPLMRDVVETYVEDGGQI